MATVTFFRQARADGGVRNGLTVGDETWLQVYYPGREQDEDPALQWYVDVRCDGLSPHDPEEARQWFLRHQDEVVEGIRNLAKRVTAGMDADIWPIEEVVQSALPGVQIKVVCSAVRRLDALQIASHLEETADHFGQYVTGLLPGEAA